MEEASLLRGESLDTLCVQANNVMIILSSEWLMGENTPQVGLSKWGADLTRYTHMWCVVSIEVGWYTHPLLGTEGDEKGVQSI